MKPAVKDIEITRGDDYELFFRVRTRTWNGTAWVPGDYRDLSGWTGLAQLRANVDATEFLSFTVTIADQTAFPGAGYMRMGNAITSTIPYATGVYDLQLTDTAGKKYTYCGGKMTLTKDVTRE